MRSFVLFALCLAKATAQLGPDGKYTREQQTPLAGYKMFWKVDATNLHLALEVNTAGWIGFGISMIGGMHGSDIVRVSEDTIEDSWGKFNGAPLKDCQQDWTLVSRNFENGVTRVEVKRALSTGDHQDWPIVDNGLESRLIVSYGATKDFADHGSTNRGMFRVNFFKVTEDPLETIKADASLSTFSLRAHAIGNPSAPFTIPAEGNIDRVTTYQEFCVNIPSDVPKAHVVAVEAIINQGAVKHVHHFVLKGGEEYLPENGKCLQQTVDIWVWAPGGKSMVLPSNVGLPIGDGDWKSFNLQIHYDNPTGKTTEDDSGVKFYYSTALREHEAAMLQLGDGAGTLYGTPLAVTDEPGEVVQHSFVCHSNWTKENIPEGGITVFGEELHMHRVGHWMSLDQYDEAGNLKRKSTIDWYNGDLQDWVATDNFKVMPGDSFRNTCVWKPSIIDTFSGDFGLGRDDEMCITFQMYYPKMDIVGHCGALQGYEHTAMVTTEACLIHDFGSCKDEDATPSADCPKPQVVTRKSTDGPRACMQALQSLASIDSDKECPGLMVTPGGGNSQEADNVMILCNTPSCLAVFQPLSACEGGEVINDKMTAVIGLYSMTKSCAATESVSTTTTSTSEPPSLSGTTATFGFIRFLCAYIIWKLCL